MSDLALGDDKVKAVFAGERIAQAAAEFSDEDWQNGLELDKSGHIENTLHNLTLILENRPQPQGRGVQPAPGRDGDQGRGTLEASIQVLAGRR